MVKMVNLIIKSNIKKVEALKELNIAGDVADELNKKIEELLKKAAQRAKANNRRTMFARDL